MLSHFASVIDASHHSLHQSAKNLSDPDKIMIKESISLQKFIIDLIRHANLTSNEIDREEQRIGLIRHANFSSNEIDREEQDERNRDSDVQVNIRKEIFVVQKTKRDLFCLRVVTLYTLFQACKLLCQSQLQVNWRNRNNH